MVRVFSRIAGTSLATIFSFLHDLFGPENQSNRVIELNASDDKGIDIVRNKIPNFVKTKTDKLRLVILDEADQLTADAQSALKKIIEQYTNNTRFCMICNNIDKIRKDSGVSKELFDHYMIQFREFYRTDLL